MDNAGNLSGVEVETAVHQEWREETAQWADATREFLNNYRRLQHNPYKERVDFSNPSDAMEAFLLRGAPPGRISVMYEGGKPVRMSISVSPGDIHIWGDAMQGLVNFTKVGNEQQAEGA